MPHEDRIDELNREINKLESLCSIKTEEINRLHKVCKNKDEGLRLAISFISDYLKNSFLPYAEGKIEEIRKYLG